MNNILGVFVYEFRMGIRRKGVWLGYGVVFLLYLFAIINNGRFLETPGMSTKDMWAMTALLAFIYNLFLPVVGGISAADRLIRDRKSAPGRAVTQYRLKDKRLSYREISRSIGCHQPARLLGNSDPADLRAVPGSLACDHWNEYRYFPGDQSAGLRFYHCLLPGLSAGDPHAGLSGTFHRLLVLGQFPLSGDVPNPQWHTAAGFGQDTCGRLVRFSDRPRHLTGFYLDRSLDQSWNNYHMYLTGASNCGEVPVDGKAFGMSNEMKQWNSTPIQFALRTYQASMFWLPAAIWVLFAIMVGIFGKNLQAVKVSAAYTGVVLPLIGGILGAYAILDDPVLELAICITPYRISDDH